MLHSPRFPPGSSDAHSEYALLLRSVDPDALALREEEISFVLTTSISAARLTEFATALLEQREIIPRARLIADRVAEVIPGSAVVVYVIPDQERPVWIPKASAGEIALGAEKVEFDSGTLGAIADNRSIVLFAGSELSREDFAHLDVRRTVNSLAYVPFVVDEILYGTVEIISYDQTPTEAMVESVTEVIGVAGPAILSALGYEA